MTATRLLKTTPQGDQDWRTLVNTLRPFVASRVAAVDADDVLQEVVLRLHRKMHTLGDEERFGAWAYRIARNTIIDHLRVNGRTQARAADLPEELVDESASESDAPSESILGAYAAACIDGLPEPYREAMRLTELEGNTQVEAARLAGVSVTAMKSRVRRGRVKVREMVERCCAVVLDARGHVMEFEPRKDDCAC